MTLAFEDERSALVPTGVRGADRAVGQGSCRFVSCFGLGRPLGLVESSQVTSVPLLDLQAQYQPIREDVLNAITRVCDSQRFILGPEVEGLERELAAMLEVKDAVGVSSGTDALLAEKHRAVVFQFDEQRSDHKDGRKQA